MGISGKPEKLIDVPKVNIPLIKRYSGGGTVVVDNNTLFMSFIFNSEVHPFEPFPNPILHWSEQLYSQALPGLKLRENDYVIGDHKIGGNAQYIKKGRWVHHTTFLWDYNPDLMNLLLLPEKRPQYRKERSHDQFITKLKPHLPSIETLPTKVIEILSKSFKINYQAPNVKRLYIEHRKSTKLIEL
ncbi:MAG: lipoate--protein ligase family protein [Rhabdochlamydiaceae bacterium]|nr:lipoate--protein ligase family protein [Candidatus Amphrikana amoebophyrae]